MALILVSLSLVVIFQARWQESLWITLAGTSSYIVHYFFLSHLGNTAAALLAGIYIGAAREIVKALPTTPQQEAHRLLLDRWMREHVLEEDAVIELVHGMMNRKSFHDTLSHHPMLDHVLEKVIQKAWWDGQGTRVTIRNKK